MSFQIVENTRINPKITETVFLQTISPLELFEQRYTRQRKFKAYTTPEFILENKLLK